MTSGSGVSSFGSSREQFLAGLCPTLWAGRLCARLWAGVLGRDFYPPLDIFGRPVICPVIRLIIRLVVRLVIRPVVCLVIGSVVCPVIHPVVCPIISDEFLRPNLWRHGDLIGELMNIW